MGSPRYCLAAVSADILARRRTVTFYDDDDGDGDGDDEDDGDDDDGDDGDDEDDDDGDEVEKAIEYVDCDAGSVSLIN